MTTSAAPAPAPAAAPSEAADAAADAASAARSAAVPKLAEDEDCGFCAYMRAGPCGETFTAWEDCVKLHQERNEDFAKKCVGATQALAFNPALPEYLASADGDGVRVWELGVGLRSERAGERKALGRLAASDTSADAARALRRR